MVAISTCNKGNDFVESMLNDDQFFADTADTPREGIEQHKKGECLNSAISKGKVLGGKKQWTHERIDKASGETTNKTYTEYKQIIKDLMANIGCLLVCTFSNFLVAVLVAAHTANNLDLGREQGLENERYESD